MTMPKYRVRLGAYVTKLWNRTFVVSAPDEQTAIEKAIDRFRKACWYANGDVADTIEVDDIRKEY